MKNIITYKLFESNDHIHSLYSYINDVLIGLDDDKMNLECSIFFNDIFIDNETDIDNDIEDIGSYVKNISLIFYIRPYFYHKFNYSDVEDKIQHISSFLNKNGFKIDDSETYVLKDKFTLKRLPIHENEMDIGKMHINYIKK